MCDSVDAAERSATCSPVDGAFFDAVKSLFALYDLVDLDRDLIREEMGLVKARWSDVVGAELATPQDLDGIENALAKAMGID